MLRRWFRNQVSWSLKIFGEGRRTRGLVRHIEKELKEILAEPDSLMEWVDVVILALDGAWRTGASAEDVMLALEEKQRQNFERPWPPPSGEDEPNEHIRECGQPGLKLVEEGAMGKPRVFEIEDCKECAGGGTGSGGERLCPRCAGVGFATQDMREIHPAAGEWQDIKDAPKYGGGFLLLGWFSDIGFLWTKGYCDEEAESGIPAWRAQQGHRVYPTHFALINPPQDAAIAKGKEEGDAETP